VEEILAFNNFLRLSIGALVTKIWPNKFVRWCQGGDFVEFWGSAFPASRVQHNISDLHYKFALGPHHVSKYGRYPFCDR